MTDFAKITCPLCDGKGELTRGEMFANLTSRDLRKRLDVRIAEILDSTELAGVETRARNFEKEVHEWNPQMPMWRRSPKE